MFIHITIEMKTTDKYIHNKYLFSESFEILLASNPVMYPCADWMLSPPTTNDQLHNKKT